MSADRKEAIDKLPFLHLPGAENDQNLEKIKTIKNN
jgi:hypothetical protein